MTLNQVQSELSSYDMTEWMAFDLTQNEKWLKEYKHKKELEKSKTMTDEQRLAAFKKLLGGN